ncbi:MAG: hypothetical protein EBR79_01125 [Proteobacteria bacterium]|nr:hypothetical protein [Pseudomonadota bacterium]
MLQLPAQVQAKVVAAQPLVGVERDEIAAMVNRIKKADLRNRQTPSSVASAAPSGPSVAWAEDWQLPREALDYFDIEQAH